MDGKVINILLVEDDKLDVINMQRTLDKMNILHRVAVARERPLRRHLLRLLLRRERAGAAQ